MEDLLSLVDQTSVLIDQCNNTVLYLRRFSLLSVLSYQFSRQRQFLCETLSLLDKHDFELFMHTFREHIIEITISNKKKFGGIWKSKQENFPALLKNPNINGETLGGSKLLFWKIIIANKGGTHPGQGPISYHVKLRESY